MREPSRVFLKGLFSMDYIKDYFLDFIKIPEEGKKAVLECEKTLFENITSEEISSLIDEYMASPESAPDGVFPRLDEIAEKIGVSDKTLSWLFIAMCAERLEKIYKEKNIPHEYFRDAMYDLNCKIHECYEVHGVWGVGSSRNWYDGFFNLTRFGIGRLSYDIYKYDMDYTLGGVTAHPGDTVLRIHIPSAGPLTKELRDDSYRRAYEFFKEYAIDGVLFYHCTSWLLSKFHYDLLPPSSNIRSFMEDFDLQDGTEAETKNVLWRIWGHNASLPTKDLPEHNSLMRAYKKLLLDGKPLIWGRGIFAFDGKNYLRSDGAHPTL